VDARGTVTLAATTGGRANRAAAADDNPFLQWERTTAELMTAWFDVARDLRDGVTIITFGGFNFDLPLVQPRARTYVKVGG
jgi:DNA polymerase elongation subunit (family B)